MNLLSTPKAPTIPPPATMPTPNSTEEALAKKKVLMAAATRTGRQSTILTDQSNALGG